MQSAKQLYDFNNPLFQKHFIYKRFAQEHQELSEIENKMVEVQVIRSFSPLQIPNKYKVIYHCKSITGIRDDQSPIYGDRHEVEISLPKKYPLESAIIYTLTPVWHPNIQFHGKAKGRICGNTTNFGKGFGVRQLVFLILDILLYKNYHAEHTPPYPEDKIVADWTTDYAEPNAIIKKDIGLTENFVESKPTEVKRENKSPGIKIRGNTNKLKFRS